MLDLTKVFETLCKDTLSVKLYSIDIHGKFLKLLSSSMSDSKIIVKLNEAWPSTEDLHLGVP